MFFSLPWLKNPWWRSSTSPTRTTFRWRSNRPSAISNLVHDFYSDLFASQRPSPDDLHRVLIHIPLVVADDMNANLLAPFTEADIKQAIFDIHPTKVPGPSNMGCHCTRGNIISLTSLNRGGKLGGMEFNIGHTYPEDQDACHTKGL